MLYEVITIREIYAEAKALGFEPKIMRHLVRLRRVPVLEAHVREHGDGPAHEARTPGPDVPDRKAQERDQQRGLV